MDNNPAPEDGKEMDAMSETYKKTISQSDDLNKLKFDFPFDLNNLFSM
jgi:hypothetical protein